MKAVRFWQNIQKAGKEQRLKGRETGGEVTTDSVLFVPSERQKALSWTSVSIPYLLTPRLFSPPLKNLFPTAFMPWQGAAIPSLKTQGERAGRWRACRRASVLCVVLCLCERVHGTTTEQTKPWYQPRGGEFEKWKLPWQSPRCECVSACVHVRSYNWSLLLCRSCILCVCVWVWIYFTCFMSIGDLMCSVVDRSDKCKTKVHRRFLPWGLKANNWNNQGNGGKHFLSFPFACPDRFPIHQDQIIQYVNIWEGLGSWAVGICFFSTFSFWGFINNLHKALIKANCRFLHWDQRKD